MIINDTGEIPLKILGRMNFKDKLSQRIGMADINEILCLIGDNDDRKRELYDLVMGDDEAIGYQAAWVFTHFSDENSEWLYDKQDELIDELLGCKHGGRRRVILNLLYRQPQAKSRFAGFLSGTNDVMPGIAWGKISLHEVSL